MYLECWQRHDFVSKMDAHARTYTHFLGTYNSLNVDGFCKRIRGHLANVEARTKRFMPQIMAIRTAIDGRRINNSDLDCLPQAIVSTGAVCVTTSEKCKAAGQHGTGVACTTFWNSSSYLH